MANVHYHYDQLTDDERDFVDLIANHIISQAKEFGLTSAMPNLANDDRAERAVDAIAEWVIASRA